MSIFYIEDSIEESEFVEKYIETDPPIEWIFQLLQILIGQQM